MKIPQLSLWNRQRKIAFSQKQVLDATLLALPRCQQVAQKKSPILLLEYIEVTVVSDRAIARVHREFFHDPTATDVITFHHGEILLGAGVIAAHAQKHGETKEREAFRCIVHGLLHLGGWEDSTPKLQRQMARLQEKIIALTWPQ